MTLEDYLRFEAASPDAHEFRGGFVVAQAVPSGAHAIIVTNLTIECSSVARTEIKKNYAGDVKVVAPSGDRLIPDFVVTRDARDREALGSAGEAQIAHPWLVVEILSPATAADDMTLKLDAYQTIAEITHYVVVDSRRRSMRVFERAPDGKFTSSGPLTSLVLPRLRPLPIAIEDVYRDTSVPALADVSPRV